MLNLVLALALILPLAGCETDEPEWDIADVRDIIEASNQKFMAAAAEGDAAAIAERYTQNARLMPPNAPIYTGQEAVRGYFEEALENGIESIELVTGEVELKDDVAMEIGEYTVTAGGETADKGKYLVIWFYETDEWKMHADVWNSSLAVPETE